MTRKAKVGRILSKCFIFFFVVFFTSLSFTVNADTTSSSTDNGPTRTDPSAPPLSKKPELDYRSYSDNPQKISLNFASIKTRELLQIFSQFANRNFIIGDKVQGSMSIHLNNIPWPEALRAILQSQGLGQRVIGQTVIIAPAAEITAEEMQDLTNKQQMEALRTKGQVQQLESQNQIESLEPLENRIILLRYSKAEEVLKLLTGSGNLLTDRGKMGVDARTNSVWVRDTPAHVRTVAHLVKKLDFPVKQVTIEARIVRIERPYEQSFGIRWGLSSALYRFSGTLAGANYGLTNPLATLSGDPAAAIPNLTSRLNFNYQATALNNGALTPASAGLALGRIGNVNIDAEISALQYGGNAEMISQPKLITSDGKPAYIASGEEIPYAVASSSGATAIEYKNASLKLEVTPHVTSDKKVMLKIKVTNNTQGNAVNVSIGGQAIIINTQEEQSEVLLNDNQTVVVGGIYTRDKQKLITRIPFLGSIPLIGYFFKHTYIRDNKEELVVFLTPHIIKMPINTKRQ